MALPQKRDPEEWRREEERRRNAAERRIAPESSSGWWGWWWLWILIIIAIIWFGGWGWGGYGGWWRGRPYGTGAQIVGSVMPSGPGLAVLNATDKLPFIGKPFQVSNVTVQNKVGNQGLWIGSHNGSPMLVTLTGLDNSAANANIRQGDVVSVTGMVEKAPPANQAKQQWSLNNDGGKRLEQQGAYIQAAQVQKTQR